MRFFGVCVFLGVLLCACGGEPAPTKDQGTSGSSPASMTTADAAAQEADGTSLAEEILANYDQAVDAMAALLKDNPLPAEVLPKIAAVLEQGGAAAKVLNDRYLALPLVPAQQAVNRTLSEKRPPAVFRKDQLLGKTVFHYRYEQASPEIVEAIEKGLIGLIDGALAPR